MSDAHILIVEDEEDLAENLSDLLELEGFETKVCHTGELALQAVEEHVPDLVLLDIQLMGMDGIEVLKRLKDSHPTLPVFMVSASSQRGMKENLDKFGADAFVLKPYDQDELLALIEKILKHKEN